MNKSQFHKQFDYATTIDLFKNACDNEQKVTYEQLCKSLNINSVTESPWAIRKLREKLKEQNIAFKSAAVGRKKQDTEKEQLEYYVVYKCSDKKQTTKPKSNFSNSNEAQDTDVVVDTLKKNNQKMYLELEELKAANAALTEKYNALLIKEEQYISIINSFHNLLSI